MGNARVLALDVSGSLLTSVYGSQPLFGGIIVTEHSPHQYPLELNFKVT